MERTLQGALRYRWVILLILSLQYLFGYFHRVAPAVVAQDLISAFSISATSLGVLASGYFYPYAIMQIPVGLLADSWGPRKTITFFALLAAFGAIAFGLSPNFGMATVFPRHRWPRPLGHLRACHESAFGVVQTWRVCENLRHPHGGWRSRLALCGSTPCFYQQHLRLAGRIHQHRCHYGSPLNPYMAVNF